jgi:hypothetical protein
MDDVARGIAGAALTLQSVLLQALVYKEVLTPTEALVDKSLQAVRAESPRPAPDAVAPPRTIAWRGSGRASKIWLIDPTHDDLRALRSGGQSRNCSGARAKRACVEGPGLKRATRQQL